MKEVDIYDEFSEDSFTDDEPPFMDEPIESDNEPMYGGAKRKKQAVPSDPSAPITVVKADAPAPAAAPVPAAAPAPAAPAPVPTPIPVVEETDDDISTEDEDDAKSTASAASSQSSTSTIDCLSRDPLFLVLSQYLSNDSGNIVDVLCKINKNLKRLVKAFEKKI